MHLVEFRCVNPPYLLIFLYNWKLPCRETFAAIGPCYRLIPRQPPQPLLALKKKIHHPCCPYCPGFRAHKQNLPVLCTKSLRCSTNLKPLSRPVSLANYTSLSHPNSKQKLSFSLRTPLEFCKFLICYVYLLLPRCFLISVLVTCTTSIWKRHSPSTSKFQDECCVIVNVVVIFSTMLFFFLNFMLCCPYR